MIPQIDCRVEAACKVNPTEDPQKIKQLFSNILDDFELHVDEFSAKAASRRTTTRKK